MHQQQTQYNFDLQQIDQRYGDFSMPIIDSNRTLALFRTATTHKYKFPMEQLKTQSAQNSKRRNPLVQRILANNASLSSFTVGYDKWVNSQVNHTSIVNKIQQCKMKKEKKLIQLQAQIDNKEMAQCTFKPETNKSKTKRNFNQFLKSQDQHTKKIQEKKQNLKKTLEKAYKQNQSFKPNINKNHKVKKDETPVYDRLYQKRQKDDQSNLSQTSSAITSGKNNIPKPSIQNKSKNTNRNTPLCEGLYQDALRRNNTQKQLQIAKQQKPVQQKKPSKSKNDKFVAQKFIKEYFYCLEDLNLDQWNQQFSQEMFKDTLKKLGFLTSLDDDQDLISQDVQNIIKSEQQRILQEAYQLLKPYGVDARNVCVFLMSLIGVYNINPVNFARARQPQSQQDQFYLDQIQGRKVQRHFIRLFHNRLSSEALKKTNYKDQNSYHPTINSQSNQMAQRHREKMLQLANQVMTQNDIDLVLPDDGSISHTDLLVIHKIAKQMQLQKLRQEKSFINDPQCTFQPNNNKNDISQRNTPRYGGSSNVGIEKSYQLYSQARNKTNSASQNNQLNYTMVNNKDKNLCNNKYEKTSSIKNNSHKNTSQDNFKKNPKSINKLKQNNNSMKNNNNISNSFFAKDIDKTLIRMYEGRKKREQQKNFLERGYGNQAMSNAIKNANKKVKDFHQQPQSYQNSSKSSGIKQKQHPGKNYGNKNESISQIKTPQFNQRHFRKQVESLINNNKKVQIYNRNSFSHYSNDLVETGNKQQQSIRKNENLAPKTIKRDEQIKGQQYDQQPLLVIDVNMGDQKEQIYIFKGDQDKLQYLVQQFCQKHQLDQQNKQQLMEMVSTQVQEVLRNINQQQQP